MNPEQLGPYRIGKPLGKGGMGVVFAAVEETTGEAAAVKVLSAVLGREEGFRDRFAAEIESLRMLRHPNIVRLLGYGVDEELHYYAMELVEGRSLEDELRAGRQFTWREVTDIGLQICRALRHAHDRGVIHRDVKPANLLITTDGSVKLSDFGIAKLFGNSGMTSNGGVLGTADFMSPEQADGRPVTHRCDLYSLGTVLYALLAGQPPFRGKSMVEVLHMQRFAEAESLRKHTRRLPNELEELVRQLMHKEPERRVPTALAATRRLEIIRELPDPPEVEYKPLVTPADSSSSPHEMQTIDQPTAGAEQPVAKSIDPKAVTSRPRQFPAGPMEPTALHSAAAPARLSTTTRHRMSVLQRRFTAVGDEEMIGDETWGERAVGLVSPGTWVLVVALLVIGFMTWYMVQPPSADWLYGRITTAVQSERIENVSQLGQDIKKFLTYYSGDSRSREVENAQRTLSRWELQRRMERLARQVTKTGTLTFVERTYLEALRKESNDPVECRNLLQQLLDVYSGEDGLSGIDRQILELAGQKVPELNQRLAQAIDEDELRERIGRIEAKLNDDPDGVRKKLESLRTLLKEYPNTSELLERIETLLKKIPAARP
jgi:serine/threonine-protein kinase